MIEIIFAAYGAAALVLFRLVAPSLAVAITCFAGWLLLPVGNFPAGSAEADLPFWITGTAIPSDMLLTKMWWPPTVALAGALLNDFRTFRRWQPTWFDIPIALWCLWPIGQWAFVTDPDPQPWIASLYLAAAWGTPWLLGHVYFDGPDGNRRLLAALASGLAVLAPIALIESFLGSKFYGWIYQIHPFRFDGQQRYVGFRPLAFFENGNQYGIWVAAIAIATICLWQTAPDKRSGIRLIPLAALALVIAVMSQSVGALLLLLAALVLPWTIGSRILRWGLPIVAVLLIVVGSIYISGKVPLRSVAENTAIGRHVVGLFRASGRSSFTWRIARDQNALPLLAAHPVVGTAHWDWWRDNNERPWGLALLIFGQFGFIGLLLAFGSLLIPAFRALLVLREHTPPRLHSATALAALVLMASADALLNSFFFYPAIMAAGALSALFSASAAIQTSNSCKNSDPLTQIIRTDRRQERNSKAF